MNTHRVSLNSAKGWRIVGGAVLGAIVVLGVGFGVGVVGIGVVWLILGVIEGLPGRELVQIVPWSLIMGTIIAAISVPLGATVGGTMVATRSRSSRFHIVAGALIGLVIGGIGAITAWDLAVNGDTAAIATALWTIVGAITVRIVARIDHRNTRQTT
jgi:hypothetical protein